MAGLAEREDRIWERVAWQTAHMIQPFTKKRIRPKDLLGRGSKNTDLLQGVGAKKAKMDRLMDRLEAQRKRREG